MSATIRLSLSSVWLHTVASNGGSIFQWHTMHHQQKSANIAIDSRTRTEYIDWRRWAIAMCQWMCCVIALWFLSPLALCSAILSPFTWFRSILLHIRWRALCALPPSAVRIGPLYISNRLNILMPFICLPALTHSQSTLNGRSVRLCDSRAELNLNWIHSRLCARANAPLLYWYCIIFWLLTRESTAIHGSVANEGPFEFSHQCRTTVCMAKHFSRSQSTNHFFSSFAASLHQTPLRYERFVRELSGQFVSTPQQKATLA